MENKALNKRILISTKWAAITEILAKLIVPITNMILARILAPEVFGVITTITMVVSFADIFTDAGFQKYLVQHDFNDDEEQYNSTNVAFWTNLLISILLWGIIGINSERIASMLGNPGLGIVITIACIQLPLTSFSSIQMAIYRREFDFKTLFLTRIINICVPFIITIPLSYLKFGYWAIIIGNICGTLSNAIILTYKSKWKPRLYYNFNLLKEMFSFSIWSLIESVAIWLTIWIDTFIIGSVLNSYYLGIYKTSLTTVNSIFGLITASTTPILFSALSRVQKDKKEFNRVFFNMQKIVAYIVIPMSVGGYIFSDLIVKILLGEKWSEAAFVVGKWSILYGFVIVLCHFSSEVYRAKGRPKLSVLAQVLHLIVLVPTCLIASRYGFDILVNFRSIVRVQFILVHLFLMQYVIGMSIKKILFNITIPIIASLGMYVFAINFKALNLSIIWSILTILISILVYIIILMFFTKSRNDVVYIFKRFINKNTPENYGNKLTEEEIYE